jgi:hypothetical protein
MKSHALPTPAATPTPTFWEQPLDNVAAAYRARAAPLHERLLIDLRVAQKAAIDRAVATATANAARALAAEVARYAADGRAYDAYERALRRAAREMRYGPACCCNRYRWRVELHPGLRWGAER